MQNKLNNIKLGMIGDMSKENKGLGVFWKIFDTMGSSLYSSGGFNRSVFTTNTSNIR